MYELQISMNHLQRNWINIYKIAFYKKLDCEYKNIIKLEKVYKYDIFFLKR
jgi:hypothetical protein